MTPKPQLRGIIFDKDGTLFDFNATWGAWSGDLIRAEAGADPVKRAALAQALGYDLDSQTFRPGAVVIAAMNDEIADAILGVIPGNKAALIDRMEAAAIAAPQVPAADLAGTLANLRARGLALGVATNDGEAPARAHLAQAGVGDAFDLIMGYDSGHGGKPAPGQLLAFCAATGLAPADCAMVGDSLHDLHAGRAAGMTTIGVLTGPALRDELASSADVILPDIGALPNWLDS